MYLLAYMAAASVILFFLMAFDKRRARLNRRRIRERTLFIWAALGGAAGGTLGMFLFRHKTRRWYFRLGFPLITLLQLCALYFIFR